MDMRSLLAAFWVATLIPAAAGAEVWRWTDARGHMVYTNVKDRTPPGAEVLGGDIGFLGGEFETAPEQPTPSRKVDRTAPPAVGETQRRRVFQQRITAISRYADLSLYWPFTTVWWRDYQADDPIATMIWLENAETQLQMRRWGFGS